MTLTDSTAQRFKLGLASQVAIIIVTRNRPDFLRQLLISILQSGVLPGHVIVIDNASESETGLVVEDLIPAFPVSCKMIYGRQEENTGGAGGFNVGTAMALEQGADWFWLMDDDVEVLPSGLSSMLEWTDRFLCFHGQRYDSDGSAFFSSQRISERLAIQIPILPDPLKHERFLLTNWACFEGLFIHRSIVLQIGLPDPRFFIVWDDAMYGFRASKITSVAFIDSFVMKRSRSQPQISLGVRHLNGASDISRFYMMRNRALIELYFRHYGAFHPVWFNIGTMLVLAKELFRLFIVERRVRGVAALWQGMRAATHLRAVEGMTLAPPMEVSRAFTQLTVEAAE